MIEILITLTGILAGGGIVWLYLKTQSDNGLTATREKAGMLENRLAELKLELNNNTQLAELRLQQERSKVERITASLSSAETKNENLEQRLSEQKGEVELLHQKFTAEFENLANRILDEKSEKFTNQNRTNLDIILNPFKERLKDFENQVSQAYKAESDERVTLKSEIRQLAELNKQISEEANNLAKALKGDNKQQGNWGEVILEKVLQRSGLMAETEYRTQVNSTNYNGDKIRPDVVVFLPDNKHVIIDSKVSLVAYEACMNANGEEDKIRHLKLHLESLRGHIKLLSDKNYQSATGFESPDFVLLFVPIESSFSLAVQGDAEIFNYAWDRKVVIVSPTTLLVTLRTIASIWKQERQTRNALQIAEEGGKLYDKFVSFYEDLRIVGEKMDSAKDNYTEALKKLYHGNGNLVKRAEKMRELGAKNTKLLPQNIIDLASE